MIEHAKFTFPLQEKLWETKTKQVNALNSVNLPNKIYELKQIESIIPKNKLNDLIVDKLNKILQLQNNIKLDSLEYAEEIKKDSLPIFFLRHISKGIR